jgi:hypothetical protein
MKVLEPEFNQEDCATQFDPSKFWVYGVLFTHCPSPFFAYKLVNAMKTNRSRFFITANLTKWNIKCLNNEFVISSNERAVSFTIFE